MQPHILIDNGDTFEGDFTMFQNCFFQLTGPTDAEKIWQIQDWCFSQCMSLSVDGAILLAHSAPLVRPV